MGVALTSNEYDRVFEKGQDLPAKQKRDYQTMVPIRRGQTGDVARIALIEGENERADRNRLVGTLEIKGEKIRRDLAAGTEVEVEIRIDESRIITVTAYVPQLDEEFKVTLDMTMHDTEPDVIAKDYQAEMTRLQELKRKVTGPEGQSVDEMLARVEESPLIQEISESLAAAKGDPDAAAKCEKRLLELKLKLDEASDALEWPELVMSARKELGYLNEVVEPHGDADQRQRAARLAEEIDGFIRERRPDFLRNRIKLVGDLWWEIVQVQPSFWINRFHSIEMQIDTLTDPVQGARLLNQGREAISKNNLVGLKNVVTLLSDLMAKKIPLRPPVGPYGTGVDRRS
jgi:molecular chaperone DnaK